MTATIHHLPASIAAHEDKINRDEWAAVGTTGDYIAQLERQRHEDAERADIIAWRAFAWFCIAFALGLLIAGVM